MNDMRHGEMSSMKMFHQTNELNDGRLTLTGGYVAEPVAGVLAGDHRCASQPVACLTGVMARVTVRHVRTSDSSVCNLVTDCTFYVEQLGVVDRRQTRAAHVTCVTSSIIINIKQLSCESSNRDCCSVQL